MMPTVIPLLDLKAQLAPLKEDLIASLRSLTETTDFVSGKMVERFEKEFAQYLGADHVVGCANGTDALELSLRALGLLPGEKVITPALSFFATASAVVHAGGIPCFIDVDPDTEVMTPDHLEAFLKKAAARGEKFRGVIPVHLRGNACSIQKIIDVARRFGLFVLEDAAQAHGARFKDQRVGTFGDAAVFSFYPGKNLGALGDGGAVATNDKEVADKLRLLCNHGRTGKYDHRVMGRNSRLDTIQAAWLSIKLKHLDSWNERRRKVAIKYQALLAPHPNLRLSRVTEGAQPIWHHFTIRHPDRERIASHMKSRGVSTVVHYPVPLHLQPALRGCSLATEAMAESESISLTTLSLPIYPELSDDQIDFVVHALIEATS
ncbi:MAG TPA: DegT/DnrJ/EryC1/StrS family aminotransferase [Bdellovibrionota bacterium]|nr:DegT/DnrJ/EryC1/StrS family aminotransferase [Bdellovibrionota bacterium]